MTRHAHARAESARQEIAAGKNARRELPLDRLGDWLPPADRRDPIAILEEQGQTRDRDLLPIRFGRMLASPFAFFRGAAAVMARDLAATPNTGVHAQICGDAHIANFGGFASPEQTLVFDLNDFDETLPGPWEWDVKRMAASVEIAGRQNRVSTKKRRRAVKAAAIAYQSAIHEFAGWGYLDVWYARLDTREIATRWGARIKTDTRRRIRRAGARAKDHTDALERLTESKHGEVRFRSAPPLVERIEQLLPPDEAALYANKLLQNLRNYAGSLTDDRRKILEQFVYRDVARRVVGIGSVGIRTSVVLLMGKETAEPLVLQVKEAGPSVLEKYVARSPYAHHGRRVVEGQRLMQATSDTLLGWTRGAGVDGLVRDYYVRQLWNRKVAPDLGAMRPSDLRVLGEMCAWTLARAHARTASRIAIASYIGGGDRFATGISEFAAAYADQNEHDYADLAAAIRSGRIIARREV